MVPPPVCVMTLLSYHYSLSRASHYNSQQSGLLPAIFTGVPSIHMFLHSWDSYYSWICQALPSSHTSIIPQSKQTAERPGFFSLRIIRKESEKWIPHFLSESWGKLSWAKHVVGKYLDNILPGVVCQDSPPMNIFLKIRLSLSDWIWKHILIIIIISLVQQNDTLWL